MLNVELQNLCERGQQELITTDYLSAVDTFSLAERVSWDSKEFDTLSRLYLPLQEARRQIRQRCGEGGVRMRIRCLSRQENIDPEQLLAGAPHGQMLIAGWGSSVPAIQVRRLAHQKRLYVETFLGAEFPTLDRETVVAIVPLEESPLPSATPRTIGDLQAALPANSLLIPFAELPEDSLHGTTRTFASVMAFWERLHLPFMAAADNETDPIKKMEAYRLTLRVDPACELAHQRLAEIARELARQSV